MESSSMHRNPTDPVFVGRLVFFHQADLVMDNIPDIHPEKDFVSLSSNYMKVNIIHDNYKSFTHPFGTSTAHLKEHRGQ